jgi:DNA excision repair protein ERCC-4
MNPSKTITPTVIIDTREQLPYTFPPHWPVITQALKTGDYTILGYTDQLSIERKSLSDLLGCIFTDRFERECERLKEIPFSLLAIEASLDQILKPKHYQGNPDAVIGKLQSLETKYKIRVKYLHSREYSQKYVTGVIHKFLRYQLGA